MELANKMNVMREDMIEKIIISQITGGLGNQLFQYAFARKLALETDAVLLLDTRIYNLENIPGFTKRNLELFNFPVHAEILSDKHLKRIPDEVFFLEETRDFIFEEISINENDLPLYIKGYWQSWKYIKPIEQFLRRELCFQTEKFSDQINSFGRMLSGTSSVGVHIRRTDYEKYPQLGILPYSYYFKAVNYFKQKNTEFQFYVFSDDTDWVVSNFNIPAPCQIVKGNNGMEDFYLMSRCRHLIIANSSYSWWAAWLNPFTAKTVVAPRYWKLGEGLDVSDTNLIPPEWISIW